VRQASRWRSVVAAALVGCGGSTLPSYGEPQRVELGESAMQGGDLIRYRKLTRDDFRAPASAERGKHQDKIGAETFAIFKTDPELRISVTRPADPDKPRVAKVEKLRFQAWMDRSRSWWNPKPGVMPASYVLEHEQIHFALFELETVAMNAEGRELMQRTFEGDDEKKLVAKIEEAVNEIMEEGMERVLETSRDFDEDTSGRHEPKKQKEWLSRVERALAAQK
jgi:hypothetical protein